MTPQEAIQVPDQSLLPTFAPHFIEDHAKRLISDPRIALVEIVANSWDAGANTVNIQWPEQSVPEVISIEDDGTGITHDQFLQRWLELNYNRQREQGEFVVFPDDNQESHRRAFGRNGKGRHSMFCFAEKYFVETWREGQSNTFQVSRPTIVSHTPFDIKSVASKSKDGHGTRIWTTLGRNYIPINLVRDLIGSKFIADPTFAVLLNGDRIERASLDHLIDTQILEIEGVGSITVSQVDTTKTSRTSHPHGIAWWVNNRLVGEVSWEGFKERFELDRRTIEAKRFTFVVEADVLDEYVLEDWSGFKESDQYLSVRKRVEENIRARILASLEDVHKARKQAVLERNASGLSGLPIDSRYAIGQMVDQIQEKLPSVQDKYLDATIQVVVNMEQTRTGHYLLEQLAALRPNELDQLSAILDRWSVQEARLVLGELERRLAIIEKLESLVDDPSADELHEIQPLFARGLWVFGPEYESIHFTSNRTLLTVVRDFLKEEIPERLSRRKRPDFVALPKSTIGIYASNSFDDRSEVDGFDKVLIVELKRGGSRITLEERRQGENYGRELKRVGKIQQSTRVVVFVLGSEVSEDVADPMDEGNMTVYAKPYEIVLQQAHARTFFLLEKIRESKSNQLYDADVEDAIAQNSQGRLI